MALVKGTNSYATVAEADTYLSDRLDTASWTSVDSTKKAQALVTATSYLDGLNWLGSAVSQSLAFPRIVDYFDPRAGDMISLDGTTVPSRIEKATIELAFHLVSNADILNASGSAGSIEVGPISLTKIKNAPIVTPLIEMLIRPLRSNSNNSWWRAN